MKSRVIARVLFALLLTVICKIPYEIFNEPKLERSIGDTTNRKNASTKYIELFCSFLRQIAPPYVPRFRSPIT